MTIPYRRSITSDPLALEDIKTRRFAGESMASIAKPMASPGSGSGSSASGSASMLTVRPTPGPQIKP